MVLRIQTTSGNSLEFPPQLHLTDPAFSLSFHRARVEVGNENLLWPPKRKKTSCKDRPQLGSQGQFFLSGMTRRLEPRSYTSHPIAVNPVKELDETLVSDSQTCLLRRYLNCRSPNGFIIPFPLRGRRLIGFLFFVIICGH